MNKKDKIIKRMAFFGKQNRLCSHLDMQKIQIIGFFFEKKLYIYSHTNKTLIHNSVYVFDDWVGGNLSHGNM